MPSCARRRLRALLCSPLGARWWSTELDSGAPRFRQSDGDCLLRGSGAVLSLAHVMDFLAHEFAGLSRRRLTRALVPTSSFYGFFLRHIHVSILRAKAT